MPMVYHSNPFLLPALLDLQNGLEKIIMDITMNHVTSALPLHCSPLPLFSSFSSTLWVFFFQSMLQLVHFAYSYFNNVLY
jgi:hypothetical protein